jgi:hypothetical protein
MHIRSVVTSVIVIEGSKIKMRGNLQLPTITEKCEKWLRLLGMPFRISFFWMYHEMFCHIEKICFFKFSFNQFSEIDILCLENCMRVSRFWWWCDCELRFSGIWCHILSARLLMFLKGIMCLTSRIQRAVKKLCFCFALKDYCWDLIVHAALS